MNLSFYHRRYSKCTKCHNIRKHNQHDSNLKFNHRASTEIMNKFNDKFDADITKDLDVDMDITLNKELDEKRYMESRPTQTHKSENEKATQKSLTNYNGNTSRRLRNLDHSDYAESHSQRHDVSTIPYEKLRELQKRRALSESYYSREIQKMIDEYFLMDSDMRRSFNRHLEPERHIKTDGADGLEQCGVITTITELDCGCVQETKKPIYTPFITDKRAHHYHHCTDGEVDVTDDANGYVNPPAPFQNESVFSYISKKPQNEISHEINDPYKTSKSDTINLRHSTPKPEFSKTPKRSFH